MHYIGDPAAQIDDWHLQNLPDNCAVSAQVEIINQFRAHPISLDEANYVAYSNGWYHPGGGTEQADMGSLMDAYGVDTHRVDHASVFDLAKELEAGHRVIVSVKSDDLWDTGPLGEFYGWLCKQLGLDHAQFSPADHAVSVTGIDVSDPAHPMVVINDPGAPDGAGHPYPLEQFMDAWENSDFFYVATNTAPGGEVAGAFDWSSILPGVTEVAVGAWTGDATLAVAAGEIVDELVNHVNWDSILKQI